MLSDIPIRISLIVLIIPSLVLSPITSITILVPSLDRPRARFTFVCPRHADELVVAPVDSGPAVTHKSNTSRETYRSKVFLYIYRSVTSTATLTKVTPTAGHE